MMEHNFMPRSKGQSKWVPTIAWSVSQEASHSTAEEKEDSAERKKEAPHLLGTLRAQLQERFEQGVQVHASFSEDEFMKVAAELENECERCTDQLNQGCIEPA